MTNAVRHPSGTFRYLPGISAFSGGTAAEDGYEFVELRWSTPRPLAEGFAALDSWLVSHDLSAQALVGLHLRSPEQLTPDGFEEFNVGYRALLGVRSLLVDDVNPIARSNVCPVDRRVAEPEIFAAFVVRAAVDHGGRDFLVAGVGDAVVRGDGRLSSAEAAGDLSQAGLARKTVGVLDELEARATELSYDLSRPNGCNVYCAHDMESISALIGERLAGAGGCGYTRWRARPPVIGMEFEMDVRRVSACQWLP